MSAPVTWVGMLVDENNVHMMTNTVGNTVYADSVRICCAALTIRINNIYLLTLHERLSSHKKDVELHQELHWLT